MSEVMTCMPFEQLMNWVLEEKKTKGTVFGQHRAYVAEADKKLNIFERNLETPIGPAAGPHTQLTQNIVASYYAGARFFELKLFRRWTAQNLQPVLTDHVSLLRMKDITANGLQSFMFLRRWVSISKHGLFSM